MSNRQICPRCGSFHATSETSGLCPGCLMKAAMESDGPQELSPAHSPTVQTPGPRPSATISLSEVAALFPQLDVLEVLGSGGMGMVCKVRQKKLDRLAALKIIRPDAAHDPVFAERFNREARTLARLNHGNIVGIYDFGEVRANPDAPVIYYFLMELVDGVNLRQYMQRNRPNMAQSLAMISQICQALQYAHSCNVVHRDIKPENILLDHSGRIRIADFGLARLCDDASEVSLTGTHQVLGTIRYMAPEQMSGSGELDHRADIYSLGVVFYELLTGEIPAGAFDPPSMKTPIDARVDEVVMKLLASDPGRRFQNAGEVSSRISRLVSESMSEQPAMFRDTPQMANEFPGPSTMIDAGAAAIAAGVRRLMPGAESAVESPDDVDDHRTHATIPMRLIHDDTLPDVCMVCGTETKRRLRREFKYTSEGSQFLIFLLFVLFFPLGIYAALTIPKKARASFPICYKHRRHFLVLPWFASLGWLIIVILGGSPWFYAWWTQAAGASVPGKWSIIGLVLGFIAYVVPVVMLATTRVDVEEITDGALVLKRVSNRFARAVRVTRS